MRYLNLRYGNPTELAHYTMGIPLATLACMLRLDEHTVRDWLSAKQRVPWWVPEYMRLRRMANIERASQVNMIEWRRWQRQCGDASPGAGFFQTFNISG